MQYRTRSDDKEAAADGDGAGARAGAEAEAEAGAGAKAEAAIESLSRFFAVRSSATTTAEEEEEEEEEEVALNGSGVVEAESGDGVGAVGVCSRANRLITLRSLI